MKIAYAIMAHEARRTQAEKLATEIGCEIQFDDGRGENANGDAAWMRAYESGTDWTVVLQDDAVCIPDFREHAERALSLAPHTCVSFYVGTSRPRPRGVLAAVGLAEAQKASWLQCETLLWGVAVAMPTKDVYPFLKWAENINLPYDERIGAYYDYVVDKPVYYTWPSLVDHADGPTLVKHADGQPRTEPRVAHRVGVPTYENSVVVKI